MIRIEVTAAGADVRSFQVPMDRETMQDMMRAGGHRVRADLADWYGLKDRAEPNRFYATGQGFRRTHFWGQVQESIRGPIDIQGGGVEIAVTDHRIMQKIRGGTITAKNVKFLTIPIHPEAYARRAAELFSIVGKLFVIRTKKGNLFLAGRGEGEKRATFYYILKRSVTQKPWPGSMPGLTWIKQSFRNGVRYFKRHGVAAGATYYGSES